MKICNYPLLDFISFSNKIESIYRKPSQEEYDSYVEFLQLKYIKVDNIINFVKVNEPNAKIRSHVSDNVRIGNYYPMKGGIQLVLTLEELLEEINSVAKLLFDNKVNSLFESIPEISLCHRNITTFKIHSEYESIHPFTDCNGRSGRVIWLWMMKTLDLPIYTEGFSQTWYYQSLEYFRHVSNIKK